MVKLRTGGGALREGGTPTPPSLGGGGRPPTPLACPPIPASPLNLSPRLPARTGWGFEEDVWGGLIWILRNFPEQSESDCSESS